MSLENAALAKTDGLPIRHEGKVHNGKVRSVYWLTNDDSSRIINDRNYSVSPNSKLGVMVISDRISAFDCNWKGENGLNGVPGKGAALNAISSYWFSEFDRAGFAGNHILETPHPLVWIVQKAEPIFVEAIARQYITGSMLRDYEKGEREFGGVKLPDGLKPHQRLSELLITPSTKGILRGIPGVPEEDDVNITRQQILDNYLAFGFKSKADVHVYETLLRQGFSLIEGQLATLGNIFVDTKFEFGYVEDGGVSEMIYIDEIGTPDSSRFWDAGEYGLGKIVENSKEGFRQFLQNTLERDVLLNKKRMDERKAMASDYRVPVEVLMEVSRVYTAMAEKITCESIPKIERAEEEILDSLKGYGIVE